MGENSYSETLQFEILNVWGSAFLVASLVAQTVKNPPAKRETWVPSLSWKDPLEKGTATHSSILAWRIPWTGSLAGYSAWGHKESDTAERTAHTAASVRWYLTVVLLGIDLMTLWGVSFQCFYYFTPKLWVQFASWIWLLETWPCSEFFSDDLR